MSTLISKLIRPPLRIGLRASCRRNQSNESSDEGKTGKIPTKEELQSRHNPLHDSMQRTGEYSRTDVKMLSQEEGEKVYILRYGVTGFKLQSGIRVLGPMAAFPRSILHWNIKSSDDINEDSLSLFTLLYPKPDLLILGVGDPGRKLSPEVFKYLRSKRINVEILPTDMACSTFNFLNSEHRYVVGGFIPPTDMLSDFDSSFMSSDFLVDSPRLREREEPGDIEREQKYIVGNLMPRMFGKEPTYEDPQLEEQEKLISKKSEAVEGGKGEPDKG